MIISPVQHKKIIDLLVSGGQVALKMRADKKLNPRQKCEFDYSTVTDADIALHEMFVPGFKDITPGENVNSEEDPNLAPNGSYSSGWVLDPIDATKNFANGGSRFGILAAYMLNGFPLHGFAYYPAPKYGIIYYTGVEDGKAFKQKVNVSAQGEVTYERAVQMRTRATISAPRINQSHTDVTDFISFPHQIHDEHSCPHRAITLFENQADILAGPPTMMDWDIGAFDAMLRRSGGAFISVETRQPLQYGLERPIERGFMQERYFAGNLETLRNAGLINQECVKAASFRNR